MFGNRGSVMSLISLRCVLGYVVCVRYLLGSCSYYFPIRINVAQRSPWKIRTEDSHKGMEIFHYRRLDGLESIGRSDEQPPWASFGKQYLFAMWRQDETLRPRLPKSQASRSLLGGLGV